MTREEGGAGSRVVRIPVQEFGLWDRLRDRPRLHALSLELTARCNNDCRHCSVNRPAGDAGARAEELNPDEIARLAEEAVGLGALWVLLTGGEPLLREDFPEIYLGLKRRGLLVSVFSNATLVTPELAALFRSQPPRDFEVTVYGVTRETYERVTRRPGSYEAFRRGLDLLRSAGVPVRLKAMALRSNLSELPEIFRFCQAATKDVFRFDPLLNLRHDGDPSRNAEIAAERLSAAEILELESADPERLSALRKSGSLLVESPSQSGTEGQLIICGAGLGSVFIGPNGRLRLCESLLDPSCLYDLRTGSLAEAVETFIPSVRARRSSHPEYLTMCGPCPLRNLCLWCPGTAHLETGRMDSWVESFCRVAHARRSLCGAAGERPGEAQGESMP